jgi:hypothetical protein
MIVFFISLLLSVGLYLLQTRQLLTAKYLGYLYTVCISGTLRQIDLYSNTIFFDTTGKSMYKTSKSLEYKQSVLIIYDVCEPSAIVVARETKIVHIFI